MPKNVFDQANVKIFMICHHLNREAGLYTIYRVNNFIIFSLPHEAVSDATFIRQKISHEHSLPH